MRTSKTSDKTKDLLYWRKRSSYYYSWLDRIYNSIVPAGRKVLHIGCGCGDLLCKVRPSYGVGIELDRKALEVARERHPHLIFECQDPHGLDLDETFDYVIVSNSLGQWHDVQKVIEKIHKVSHTETRVVITYYNHLWEWVLRLGARMKLRQPLSCQNWLPSTDIANVLHLSNFDVIRTASYVSLPKRIPILASLFNYVLSVLPGSRWFNLITLLIARPHPEIQAKKEVSVSIIVPCRNERGNIESAVNRIPSMGKETEIVFVDGNSTDGTVDEIKQQIEKRGDRSIKLIHQGAGIGKGDAVRKGFAAARGDVFIILDADLTVPPEDLPKFFNAWCEGKGEFVNGTRLVYPLEKQAMQRLNYAANKFFGMLFTWLLDQRFRDTLCGTKLISRYHYNQVSANRHFFGELDPFGDFDLIFGAIKQNLKVVEVPVRYRARTYGTTNISRFRHGVLLLRMSVIAFRRLKWVQGYHHSNCDRRNGNTETIDEPVANIKIPVTISGKV